MLNQNQLDDLAAKLSALPCPVCGRCHSVGLKLNHAVSRSAGSDRPVVTYSFPDTDTCEGFRQKAIAFASRMIGGMNAGPYPFDRI